MERAYQIHIQKLLNQAKEHRFLAQRYELEANRIKHKLQEEHEKQKSQQTECSS